MYISIATIVGLSTCSASHSHRWPSELTMFMTNEAPAFHACHRGSSTLCHNHRAPVEIPCHTATKKLVNGPANHAPMTFMKPQMSFHRPIQKFLNAALCVQR